MNNIGKYVIKFLINSEYPNNFGKVMREEKDYFIVRVSNWEELWLKRNCKIYNSEKEMFEDFNNRRKNIINYI
jgi:hypothetical protein